MNSIVSCCICLDDIAAKPSRQPTKSCNNHNIHIDCFESMIKSGHNKCPLCRAEIDRDEVLEENHDDLPDVVPVMTRQMGHINEVLSENIPDSFSSIMRGVLDNILNDQSRMVLIRSPYS